MEIKGFDLMEISKMLQPYVTDYFACCELMRMENGMFTESNLFKFEEVKHLIPNEYKGLFESSDYFNGACGFLEFNYQAKRYRGHEYTVMLLSNEDYSKALFLYVQENNLLSDEQKDILIADLTKK